ncbi:MAG: regulatory protein, partial [Acidobacteriota bacterium]|nr:regulatory protein [Acidobacteriota bacterium]
RRKLQRRQFTTDEIDDALVRLHAEKWLDDERFAGAFVRARANKRIGKSRIRRELQSAGVGQETVAAAIEQHVDPEREQEQLLELMRKRARALTRRHGEGYVLTDQGRNKLTGYLLKQGYDAGLVYQALKELSVVESPQDHQSDP